MVADDLAASDLTSYRKQVRVRVRVRVS